MIEHRKTLNTAQQKGSKNPISLKRTKKISSEQNHQLAICDICGYKPSKKSPFAMRVHKEAVHFGIKYHCPRCQHPCTTKSNLKSHIAVKHEGTMFQCSSCSYTAKASYSLKVHNESKHLGLLLFCKTSPCDF